MDCDRVFFVLTAGPFPTGGPEDRAVIAHLDCCYSCQQIAEALRPATDTFHEAVPASEGRDLPGYWREGPTHSEAYKRVASAVFATPATQSTVRRPPSLTPAQQVVARRIVLRLLAGSALLTVAGLTAAYFAHF